MARVLTWNVAGRVKDSLERQIAALAEQPADVVCLQEVTPTSLARWTEALSGRGLHVAVSPWLAEPLGSRRLAVLVASRAPVVPVAVDGLPWPERHLAVRMGERSRVVDPQGAVDDRKFRVGTQVNERHPRDCR